MTMPRMALRSATTDARPFRPLTPRALRAELRDLFQTPHGLLYALDAFVERREGTNRPIRRDPVSLKSCERWMKPGGNPRLTDVCLLLDLVDDEHERRARAAQRWAGG